LGSEISLSSFSVDHLLDSRREGQEQSDEEIRAFIDGVVSGAVSRPQAAAWLAFVFVHGMTDAETVSLTRAMTESGETLSWPGMEGPFVDKHSTGGVGDKVSLVLAPMWAAMGLRVPMLSGRGLGITGGTLDKLESIPGFRTDLTPDELRPVLETAGCFINGQTASIAPADRILYALRDETQTVPSIPLITSSILSKKLVEGIDRLVLDVKCGSGAFMKTRAEAKALSDSLVRVGCGAGVETSAHVTDMSAPLGRTIGNALEVQEAVETLQGNGPPDLIELCAQLSGNPAAARESLDDGSAWEKWCAMVRGQGGDPEAPLLGADCGIEVFESPADGILQSSDAGELGMAAFRLGAGRTRAEDSVHPGVGLKLFARVGDSVHVGQPLASIYHDEAKGLEEARAHLLRGFVVG
jgi:thymidine phosphorylase